MQKTKILLSNFYTTIYILPDLWTSKVRNMWELVFLNILLWTYDNCVHFLLIITEIYRVIPVFKQQSIKTYEESLILHIFLNSALDEEMGAHLEAPTALWPREQAIE
jgi:hypothetical protein